MIKFITGNKGKFKAASSVISNLEQYDIDLPEIQEVDSRAVIEAKLKEAFQHHEGEFLVEDVSLRMECLNGLPGPLIKWFIKTIGLKGLADIAEKFGNDKASVSTIYAYAKNPDSIHYFESETKGRIVQPRGQGGMGWDPIFVADGDTRTFAEIQETNPEPNQMRLVALNKLKSFLSDNGI
jgi:non-canonical purine NTP pyrophosphatase (RdgB/HAM1 family)